VKQRSDLECGAALLALVILGWYPFKVGERVPLLGGADFGVHELGHLLMYPLPVGDFLTAFMGNGLQTLAALAITLWFWFGRMDHLGAAVTAAYIADAPFERLQLWGNGQHDWAYLLGSRQLDVMDNAAGIAQAVKMASLLLWIGAVGVVLWEWRPRSPVKALNHPTAAQPMVGKSVSP
jgi:hypothetical protein